MKDGCIIETGSYDELMAAQRLRASRRAADGLRRILPGKSVTNRPQGAEEPRVRGSNRVSCWVRLQSLASDHELLLGLAGFLLTIGIIVIVHEGGHFFTAKFFNIKVTRFSFGMGPVLWRRRKGETEYCFSACRSAAT